MIIITKFTKVLKKAAICAAATASMIILTGCPAKDENPSEQPKEEVWVVVYPDPDNEVHLHTVLVSESQTTTVETERRTRPTTATTTTVETERRTRPSYPA